MLVPLALVEPMRPLAAHPRSDLHGRDAPLARPGLARFEQLPPDAGRPGELGDDEAGDRGHGLGLERVRKGDVDPADRLVIGVHGHEERVVIRPRQDRREPVMHLWRAGRVPELGGEGSDGDGVGRRHWSDGGHDGQAGGSSLAVTARRPSSEIVSSAWASRASHAAWRRNPSR